MLEIVDVHAGYGLTNVLHGVSIAVPDGSVYAVMGHNGAGKTTLLKTVMGLISPRRGKIILDGDDITRTKPHQRVARGMAYVPQGQLSFGQLSTLENLQVAADNRRNGKAKIDEMLDLFPALRTYAARKAGLLSGGQRQQLSIARALITEPRLIILDEPTEGIQPSVVAEIEDLIVTLARTGLSVLLVEQHVGFALTASAEYAVMASGHVTSRGSGGRAAVDSVVAAMSI
ncbi:MAG TPA: ATP-binding cassette domain-containing protein [Propionibacteriaceae bacterium]|nr:ATP-binding cassette domain-containing protein [Propionibacteriaceae bacterium]